MLKIEHFSSWAHDRQSINLRELDLCAGGLSNLRYLELTRCDLPTKYSPLPRLLSCLIVQSRLSRDDLISLITAAPALEDLTLKRCEATRSSSSEPPPATPIYTRLESLCISECHIHHRDDSVDSDDDGDGEDDGGDDISLVSALDYFQAPDLNSFQVTLRQSECEAEPPRMPKWISTFSSARQDKISTLGIRLFGTTFYLNLGRNFNIKISAETPEPVILGFVNAIHSSAYPFIATLQLNLSQAILGTIFPTLTSKFTAVTKLVVYEDNPQLWLLLGQKSDSGGWGFPHLETFQVERSWMTGGADGPLMDMLRARRTSGLQTLQICDRGVSHKILKVAKELGLAVKGRNDVLYEEDPEQEEEEEQTEEDELEPQKVRCALGEEREGKEEGENEDEEMGDGEEEL